MTSVSNEPGAINDSAPRGVTRDEAIAFLETAFRNWPDLPRLSEDDIGDVASALLRFTTSRHAALRSQSPEPSSSEPVALPIEAQPIHPLPMPKYDFQGNEPTPQPVTGEEVEVVAWGTQAPTNGDWWTFDTKEDAEQQFDNGAHALVRLSDYHALKAERDEARQIVRDIHWMAVRYADGRKSYAPGMLNDALRKAYDGGWLTYEKFRQHDLDPQYAREGDKPEWRSIEARAEAAEARLSAVEGALTFEAVRDALAAASCTSNDKTFVSASTRRVFEALTTITGGDQ